MTITFGPKLVPRGPKITQVGPQLLITHRANKNYNHLWPKLIPSWAQDVPKWAYVDSCWPQVGPMQGVAKACQGVHEGAASKAQVFQDVHEGSASGVPTFDCSFGLFHPLPFDLEGCFFLVLLSACPVMPGLSKRFIQTFLSSSSCRQLFLKFHPFSCIARRHSST